MLGGGTAAEGLCLSSALKLPWAGARILCSAELGPCRDTRICPKSPGEPQAGIRSSLSAALYVWQVFSLCCLEDKKNFPL